MKTSSKKWLLLVTNLPGQNQTLRMRVWRALKAAGAGLLRDGVYVLPRNTEAHTVFEAQAREIRSVSGGAHVLKFEVDSMEQENTLIALFDRSAEYQEFVARLEDWRKRIPRLMESEARKALASITRDAANTVSTDLFPGRPQEQLRIALAEAKTTINACFSPDEPTPARRKIPRRQLEDFRAKTWATRQHLRIDRVCSAWLIRRFIDPKAKFVWLKRIVDKPKRAVGFDFDGALFSHVDSKVTFEVLVTSFGLDADVGLAQLGLLVHFLDVGGIPVAEAQGLAAIISGARALQPDDDQLLSSVTPALDSLYHAYLTEGRT